uniref:Guanylate-binding protein 4-like n=1 Tax=Nicotiana sylvestris TaxID=4096 RepID=A0A1U7WMD9_NICSY
MAIPTLKSSAGDSRQQSSSSPSPPLSSLPSSVNIAAGPERAVRFVYCDEEGKFQIDHEALAIHQLVKEPVGIVSVCGRARQVYFNVSSFNWSSLYVDAYRFPDLELLGRSSGFQLSPTHRPCTKGIWLWSAPLRRTALDGTEYNLLLLDTEGINAYDQTETYSIQILSLAVLLSSMLVYNQMGDIDEAAIDRLSLVTEMASASELGQFSPIFVWLFRDFYLDLVEDNRKITPRDYLELALRPVQGGGRGVDATNEIRESIRALFPDRECFSLVRPLSNENALQRLDRLENLRPEFKAGFDALKRFVFERTRPKQVGGTIMTGPLFARITQSFLDALNNGAVPTFTSSWQVTDVLNEWKKLNRKTIGQIRQWIDDSVFHHVAQETDAYALWVKLEGMYQAKTARNKALLMRRLVNLKLKHGTSVAEHTSEFQSLINQLSSVDMPLGDEMKALLLLSSLPDSWETLVVSLKRGKQQERSQDKRRGRIKSRGKSTDGRKSSYACYHCGIKGHLKKNCRKLHKEKEQLKQKDGDALVTTHGE